MPRDLSGHASHASMTYLDVLREGLPEARIVDGVEGYWAGTVRRGVPPGAARIRCNEREMHEGAHAAFREAVCRMVADGTYERYVRIHAEGDHRMHFNAHSGIDGALRFLPWHRAFLYKFESDLRAAHEKNGGDPADLTGVPYWRWNVTDPGLPAWLDGFLPMGFDPVRQVPIKLRSPGAADELPRPQDVAWILTQSHTILRDAGGRTDDHLRFSLAIEGRGEHPDGTAVRAHNQVHAWTGGVLSNVMCSPIDPIFWLLHAEVDRLWHIWQLRHADIRPKLRCEDSVLTPWSLTVDDVIRIADLGYRYDSESE